MTFEDKNKHFTNIIVALATSADTSISFEYVECQASVKRDKEQKFP